MDINEILVSIIKEKHDELMQYRESGIFEQIREFEGNAIGQIGEKFVKEVFKDLNIEMKPLGEVIHDEYDICLKDNTKIEIKTARKGIKNNTYQFNGISPHYNCKYIFCIGIKADGAFFKIIDGEKIYDHKSRSFYLKVGDRTKKLVAMNPQNQVNFKLTLSQDDLLPIEQFEETIKNLFGV